MNHLSMVLTRVNPWVDLGVAADYAGVPYAEVLAAACSGSLGATLTHSRRPGEWMIRLDDVDLWLGQRAVRPDWHPDSAA